LYARDPNAAPDDWHRASSLAAQSVICEMTCARSCGAISQAHELSMTPNRTTLTPRGFARIVTSSAHLKMQLENTLRDCARIRWSTRISLYLVNLARDEARRRDELCDAVRSSETSKRPGS
jgi:hypothetical protein